MKNSYQGIAGRLVCGSWLVASLQLAPLAFADGRTGDSAANLGQEIVVTATRAVSATKTDTPLVEIPQSISVVTSQQIIDQGALTMQDALAYTAGVTNNGDDSRGDFNVIRGFLSEEYLDGLKRNFGFVYLPRTEVYSLDRLDVLLGPSAVLYGAGSSGGLVNMVSKRPLFDFASEVTASFGTYDRKQAQFDVTGPLSSTVAARLVGVYRDSDMMIKYLPDNRELLQPSVTWKPDDRTELTLIGLYQRDYTGPSQNYVPLAASLYAPPGRAVSSSALLGEPTFNKGPKEDTSLTVLFQHSFSDAVQFRSSSRDEADHTSYGEIYGTWSDDLNPFINPARTVINRALFAYDAHYHSFDSDNNLQLKFTTGPITHETLIGVDYSNFRQAAIQAYGAATPINIYDPVYGTENIPQWGPQTEQVLRDVGVYGQDQIRFKDIVTLVLGVRHDHLLSENTGLPNEIDNSTTYRAGLTVDAGHDLHPYVSFSQSFQPVAGLNQFNQSFIPIYGEAYEAGVKWQPLRGTLVRAALYDITEKNHLVPSPDNSLVSIQSGKAYARGLELQADHRVANDIMVTASYSHNSARVSGQDRQQDITPEDTAALFATKTSSLPSDLTLRYGGGVRWVGRQLAGDVTSLQVITPSFTLADLLLALERDRWVLQVNADNLFNHSYYSACSQYGYCENGERRTVNVAATYRFR